MFSIAIFELELLFTIRPNPFFSLRDCEELCTREIRWEWSYFEISILVHNQNTRGNKMSTQKFINFNNTVACLTWVNCSLWDENALKCHQGSYQLCAFSVCSWSFHVQTGRKQKASFVTTTKYTTDQMGRWSNKLLCSKTPPASYILEPQQERLQKTEKKQIFKFLLINENV